MKYKITVVMECETIEQDKGADYDYIADVVGEVAAQGAIKHTNANRNPKVLSTEVEFTQVVRVK